MYRFLLTPRWWGINVFAVLAIPFCIFMGSWQLSRFDARVATHQQQENRSAQAKTAAARPLDSLLPVDQVTSGRQASARGHYDTAHQLLVPGRTLKDKNGDQQGFYVLTLLRTDSGKALPVVRGWLPGDANVPADTAKVPAPPKGEAAVTGALQASENQGTDGVQAGGGLPQGQLGMISAASLVNIVPYGVYDAWITLADPPAPLHAVPPVAAEGGGLDMKAFQNLGYTGEWFVFAGFVVFMWFRLVRREAEAAKDAALGILPEGPAGTYTNSDADTNLKAAANSEDASNANPLKGAGAGADAEAAAGAKAATGAPGAATADVATADTASGSAPEPVPALAPELAPEPAPVSAPAPASDTEADGGGDGEKAVARA